MTNTGARAGDEVVQLYIGKTVSNVRRPVKLLRGFERVHLEAGKTSTVQFRLGPEELQYYDREMKLVVEPGQYKAMVGPNSVDLQELEFTVAP